MSAVANKFRCLEVARKDSLIAAAISPTEASWRDFKYLIIAKRRLLAKALSSLSNSFIAYGLMIRYNHYITIPPFARIRPDRRRVEGVGRGRKSQRPARMIIINEFLMVPFARIRPRIIRGDYYHSTIPPCGRQAYVYHP